MTPTKRSKPQRHPIDSNRRGPTLDKCIDARRVAESAAKQAKEMSNPEANRARPRSRIRPTHSGHQVQPPGENSSSDQRSQGKRQCRFCGRHHVLQPGVCSALRRKCDTCGKMGHFAAVSSPEFEVARQPSCRRRRRY